MSRWFRLYSEFATDARVQMLTEAEQRRFVMLLCIDCEYPKSTISDGDMAWRMRITDDEWAATKGKLVTKGLIGENNKPTYDLCGDALLRLNSSDWAKIRTKIFERDNHTCVYCGASGVALQCDHVVPVTRGGDHSEENLVTSCRPCNAAKRDKLVSIDQWKAVRRGLA